mmetsp:Transcript_19290/g.47702  ORF Transcript_19290/g.47702 Transcript_19290/m.47702 type:complete len:213 (-) Transcript_19290:10-648(-)
MEIIELLLANCTNIDVTSTDRWTPLHCACIEGHLEVSKLLVVQCWADVDARTDCDEETPLHYACEKGHLKIVELLVKNGANVHAENDNGETPLYKACKVGHLEIVKVLHEHGAEIHAKDHRYGPTLLQLACQNGRLDVARWLIENSSYVEAEEKNDDDAKRSQIREELPEAHVTERERKGTKRKRNSISFGSIIEYVRESWSNAVHPTTKKR